MNEKILALKLSKFCKLSYKNNLLPNENYVLFKFKNNICVIFEEEEYVYGVFRGTDELADLTAVLFYNNEENTFFCKNVAHYLKFTEKKIILTGHSLGGYLAQITCSFLQKIDTNGKTKSIVEKVVTFGCPKNDLEIKTNHDIWIHKNDFIFSSCFKSVPCNGKVFCIKNNSRTFFKNFHSINSYVKELEKISNGICI